MVKRILSGFSIALAFYCFDLFAQPSKLPDRNIIFEQLPDKLGLSQSSINCILQDSDGYLWMGTWSGLIRYDGYTTKVFYSENAPGKIKSNKITNIYEDKQGFLWITTHMGGLFQYDKHADKFTNYKNDPANPESLSNNNVWCILEDDAGDLWVGTENGLNYFNRKENKFRRFFTTSQKPSLTHNFITNLCRASNGDIWIATEYGLNRLQISDRGGIKDFTFENFLYEEDQASLGLHNYIYQVCELMVNGKSSIWFCTKKGIKKVEEDRTVNFAYPDKPSSYNFFRSLFPVTGDMPYLLVGSEVGLNFFDPVTNNFLRCVGNFDEDARLSHSTVTSVYIDRGGVLWVGTKKGLNKFDSYSKNFAVYPTASFDPTGSIITGIQSSKREGYWISTMGGGLFRFNPDGDSKKSPFIHYKIKSNDENDFTDFIQTLYTDSQGRIWIGTAGEGVFVIDEKNISTSDQPITQFIHYDYHSKQRINDEYIMSFAEDKGAMWVGTWSGGLIKIIPGDTVIHYDQPLLNKMPMVALHVDNAGTLWIGTRGRGLYRVRQRDQIEVKQFQYDENDSTSLCNNFVNTILEDHAGSLWIGTEGGLAYFDRRSEKFKSYSIKEGTGNNVVVSLLEDDRNTLWFSHWDGITAFHHEDTSQQTFRNYDSHDRIQGGFFYNNVCYKDKHGKLFFGGSNGFNIIIPDRVEQNPIKPHVVIKEFQIFNKPILFGEVFNNRVILDKPISQIQKAVLKHFENSISFEFASLDYAAPEKTRYAYKLEGFDRDWNYTDGSRRYANYTNLSEGNYVFRVRATNSDGIWNSEESTLRITIRPPWWKTNWAFVLYMAVIIGVLYLFRRIILMRVNFLHEIKLERVQRENMEKLNKAKLQFFTNISHEFRTPLTLILGPVQNMLDLGEGGKFFRNQLMIINNNAQRLLRLVNQLLDFRKVESGNMKLEVAESNIVRFVKEIKLSFEALAEEMKVNFSFHASSNVIKVWFDRDQFEKIIFNLLSNAFKNTSEGGQISIQLIEAQGMVHIIVEDSGKGIKPEHFDHIFQTFFSYDQDRHHTGTGIGLALTKSLVDLHHGEIKVESKENEFTRFTVSIPLGCDHFDKSEFATEKVDAEDVNLYTQPEPIIPGKEIEEDATTPALKDMPKILLVEDNAEVRSYLRSFFIGKYVVLEAEEGKEGLDVALEEMPDIIISDVMMPIMDGINLCRQLKSNVKTSHIPVILLTARTSLVFKVEGLETGADDYITKPFNPRLLVLKVQNLIRSREAMRKLFHDSGVLTIEPKHVTLTSADELFMQKILESVERNISNAEYSVEDFGRDVGMSRTQLYRKLKALTGQSPNELIRTFRLKRAAQLLEQKQLTISEITYEVGFTDLQYFRDCFKKLFGRTPTEYIQLKAGKKVADLN